MFLLFFDIIIIFTEMFLMSAFPPCSIIVRDCISCCGEENNDAGHDRWLAEEEHEEICPAGYHETGEASCDNHKWHGVHAFEEALFYTTVTILSVFFVEIFVEVWALTPCIFFRQLFYALDFFIISVSLVFELFFHFAHRELLEELIALGVIFRLW
jgi:hypothetical protein